MKEKDGTKGNQPNQAVQSAFPLHDDHFTRELGLNRV